MVASDTYQDPKLGMLRAPAHDAQELARVLGDPAIGAFSVTILQNEPEYRLRRAIGGFFNGVDREDVLLLHLACHGVKDEDGTLYFAAADTETDNLQATALPADFVNSQMNRSPSRRIVLLLDCCYSGAFARGMSHRSSEGVQLKEQFEGSGRVVLTASSSMEYAWEGDDLQGEGKPSVFTSALVRGLEAGEADLDRDGQVSVDDLYEYVFERVRQETPNQTPGKWSFDVAGDLFIAKTKRGAEPVAPPDYLLDLIRSPLSSARVSAVEALRLLLLGNHVGAALGARVALEQLLQDDSRAVSSAASEALSGARELKQTGEPKREETLAAENPARVRAELPAADLPRVREPPAGNLPSKARGGALAGLTLLSGGLMIVGYLVTAYEKDGSSFRFVDHPLLWTDLIGAIILALVCSALLLANPSRGSLSLSGLLAGVGLEQVGAQLGNFLGFGAFYANQHDVEWGIILSLIGAGLLLSGSARSYYRSRTAEPIAASARFTRTSRAVAGLGALVYVSALFLQPDEFNRVFGSFTIPLALTTVAVAVSIFLPLGGQAAPTFLASALVTYGSLLGLGSLLFDLSAGYNGTQGGDSLAVRAVAGFLLVAAGVIAFVTARRDTRSSPNG
jgi:hypothetical protein